MKVIWGTKNKGLFFRRILLWYMTSTVLIYLVFGIVTSMSVQKNYRDQIAQLNERAIAQSVNTCTAMLRDLYNYYFLNVLGSAELTELLLADAYSADLSIQFHRLNDTLIHYSELVESSYVINLKSGFVCSTMDTYRHMEEFPDQDILRQIELLQDIPREYIFIPRQTSYTIRGNSYSRKYISLIFKKYREGYFVINLNYDMFAGMVNYRNYNEASRAILVNELGMVMADSSEALFGENISQEPYMEKVAGVQAGEGQFRITLSDGKKRVYYCKNQLFGISYLILADEPFLGSNTLLLRVIVYAVAAVAVNLGLIVLGAFLLYGPIDRLRQLLGTQEQGSGSKVDEFQEMERIFNGMRGITREYSRSRRNRILKELLEDKGVGGGSSDSEYEKLEADLSNALFVCVNLYPNPEESKADEDMSLILFSMENILRELLEPSTHLACVDCGTYLACVLNPELSCSQPADKGAGNPALRQETLSVTGTLRKMQEKMSEFFCVDVTCSIGTMVGSLGDISESYEAALTAAFFQMTREKRAILRYSEVEAAWLDTQEFPAESVRDILDAVKNGDQRRIRGGISGFFGRITHYHYYQAVKCLQLLELEITRLEMKYGIYHEDLDGAMAEGVSEKRLYKLQEVFLARSLDVSARYREKRENNPNMKQIVEQVKTLVEENLTQRDLSVTFIARKLYLSTNYVRNIFKEVTGEPLSSYIISKRLAKICEILLQTDWSGQQIADYMGFASKSYFYTFFKNYMGVTPSQYRKNDMEGNPHIPEPEGEEEED